MSVIVLRPGGGGSGGSSGPAHFAVAEKVLSSDATVTSNQRAWTYLDLTIPPGTSMTVDAGGSFTVIPQWP